MNRKGFTLVELLAVVVILSMIMMIAIPNVISILDKSKKQDYLADAKKLVTQVEYELRNGSIEKPSSTDILKVRLSYVGTRDVSKDPDGNRYDIENSYVIIVRKDGYLEYYVNLVTVIDGENKGIPLTHSTNLDSEEKLSLVQQGFSSFDDNSIKNKVGVDGVITIY